MPGWDQVSQVAVGGEGEVRHGAVDGPDQLGDAVSGGSGAVGVPRRALRALCLHLLRGSASSSATSSSSSRPSCEAIGEALARGVGDQLQDPAQLAGGQPAAARGPRSPGADGRSRRRPRPSASVTYAIRPARAEHLRQPHPYAGGVGEGAGGAVAVGEPVQAAADDDGARAARLVDGDAVHVLGGGHLVRTASRARAAQAYVEPARHRSRTARSSTIHRSPAHWYTTRVAVARRRAGRRRRRGRCGGAGRCRRGRRSRGCRRPRGRRGRRSGRRRTWGSARWPPRSGQRAASRAARAGPWHRPGSASRRRVRAAGCR